MLSLIFASDFKTPIRINLDQVDHTNGPWTMGEVFNRGDKIIFSVTETYVAGTNWQAKNNCLDSMYMIGDIQLASPGAISG